MNLIDTIIRRLEVRLLGKLERYVATIESAHARAPRAPGAAMAVVLLAVALAGGALSATQARAQEGVYTEAQAESGERLYTDHCAGCHGVKLEGLANAPALSGQALRMRCADNGQTLDDLFYIMRAFMPYNEPGKLAKQQYVEIMAYVLKVNGFVAGTTALSSDESALQRLSLVAAQP